MAESTGTATPENLTDVLPQAFAQVIAVDAPQDDAMRLKALGLCVGRRVQVIRPGDPLVVRVVGARVGLSARLAAGVQVELNTP